MTGAAARARCVRAGAAQISYLEAGTGPPLALLHGIGSAAASFWNQFEELSARFRVLAWDAPGYGASTALGVEHPGANNYAAALDDWLGALGIARCHLLGHSLGSLIAAHFAAQHPERVITLTLAGVARGHGHLPPPQRERLLAQRLADSEPNQHSRPGPPAFARFRGADVRLRRGARCGARNR